jgi:hypothetical protein
MMNAKDRMNEQIREHGENLKMVFGLEIDGDKLARKLHSIEVKAHKLATDYCNGDNNVTTETWEPLTEEILDKVDKITNFKSRGIPVFVNGDARGYALKIDDSWVNGYTSKGGKIHRDWGGYGILAPEFDGKL